MGDFVQRGADECERKRERVSWVCKPVRTRRGINHVHAPVTLACGTNRKHIGESDAVQMAGAPSAGSAVFTGADSDPVTS